MKNIIRLAILVFLVSTMACEGPRDARSRRGASNKDPLFNSNDYSGNNNGNGIIIDEGGSSSSGGGGGGSSIPPEISSCQWSTDGINGFQSSSSHLGAYTLCQSSVNETDVYLQVKTPITDSQICIIPTFNNGASSIYIGEPRCLSVVDNKRIYKIGLLKNRAGYSNFSVTGAMVMKDKAYFYPSPFYQYLLSPDAYIFCSNYLDQQSNSSYCQSFQSVNQYVYHPF